MVSSKDFSLLVACCFLTSAVAFSNKNAKIYSNEFAVHIPEGGDGAAEFIANKHGFVNRGQIGSLKGFYLFEHNHVHKRSLETSDVHHEKLMNEPEVHWVQQQHERKRRKRDYSSDQFGSKNSRIHYRAIPSISFPDPLFKEQWYLNGGAKDGLDMNVGPAWQKGYSGKGVVVSILDDGIQTNHPDLAQNYDPLASTDINGNDDDPMPQDNGDNKHGTRCAGEVAAVAYNQFCGVGVAFNSSIGGVRMLDGVVNDAVEARALGLNPEHIDIYSASWGPEDDGKTVDGPGPLARRAFIYGVTSGRKGKGSIFVWASGNGGRHTDSCNCDGYTNSIFTLSISSATQGGYKPWYLEECSSTLATTYSSGTPGHDKSVATVDMDGRLRPDHICTVEHTGTSASAPLAAGICALALEANPGLTWRDMQYLVVLTSRSPPLEKESGWITNGVKRKVSHKFGYGLMDAGALVNLAERWTSVPPQHICKSREIVEDREIGSKFGDALNLFMDVDACANSLNEVRYLEHVQCKITLRFFPRGNLRILLTSPMGTQSTLLFERPRDVISSNFDDWPFLSVHFWGERAAGRWTLQVINAGNRHVNQPGVLKKWQLVFYGTNQNPIRPRQAGSSANLKNPWKLALGNFFSPTPETVTHVPDNFFAQDIFKNFNNFPNVYTFSGSEQVEAVSSLDGKKTNVRANSKDEQDDVIEKDGCDEQCDYQGCFGQGPSKCVACKNKNMDGTCVKNCPPRSYANSDNLCKPCHEACSECTGAAQNDCASCSPGYLHVLDLNVCLQQCPEGYFEDYSKKTCKACQPNCAACQDSTDHCTSCDHHLILYKNKCLASCPAGTYETEFFTCAPCHPSCETCNGSNNSQCVSCGAGRFWHEGNCVKECPAHHFPDANQAECLECPPGCSECNKTTCITCLDDWLVNGNGRCVPSGGEKCGADEYLDGTLCKPCHSTCESCDGPTESACLSCTGSLMLQDTKCVASCKPGTFHDELDKSCRQCQHNCAKCFSKSNCTECKSGLQLQGNECQLVCAPGYYSDKGRCERCYMSCKTCSGPRQNDCVSCPIAWQLLEGSCMPNCPKGYYKTEFGCQKCYFKCTDCPGCWENVRVGGGDETKKINVEALLLSSESVPSLQFVNNFNPMIVIAIAACLCFVMLLVILFLLVQRGAAVHQPTPNQRFNKVSIKKPRVTCNYNVVSLSDGEFDDSDSDSSEDQNLIKTLPEIKRTATNVI